MQYRRELMLLKRSALSTLAAISLISFSDFSIRPTPAVAEPTIASTTQPAVNRSTIASILPAETLGIALISTQDDRWRDLSQFQLFPDGLGFPGTLLYPGEKGTSFEQEIQPWLGEQFGVAILSEKSIVMLADVKDSAALERYVDRVKAGRTQPPQATQYKGVTILEFAPENSSESKPSGRANPKLNPDPSASPDAPQRFPTPKLAIAVLPNHFVSASSTEAIKELLDAQGSLADNPKFQKTQQNPKAARSLVTLYGKYADLIKAANQFNRSQIEQLSKLNPNLPVPPTFNPSLLDPLAKFYDTAEGYVWVESTGLRAQFAVNLNQAIPESLLSPLTTRNEILDRLPQVNYMVTNSQNLALYWQVLTLGLESQPAWKKQLEQGRQWVQSLIGVDDRDILPWMNGEYVLFAYPTRQGFIPSIAPNIDIAFGMMVQTSDRAAAEAGLKKFNDFMMPRLGKAFVQQSTIAGQPVTNYGPVDQGRSLTLFSHGWTDDTTMLMLFGGGSLSEFSPKPSRTLPQAANFQAAIAPFPNANLGYFYINQGAFMSLVNTGILPLMFGREERNSPFVTQVQESFNSIRSISAASAINGDQIQVEGYLALTPRLNR